MNFLNNKMYFYHIDVAYLKALHDVDAEVQYNNNYENKPFIGIIVSQNNHNYFVPLTSGKPKHLNWPNTAKSHVIIFEDVEPKDKQQHWVCKLTPENKIRHILSVLEIKKMIPVPNGVFQKIDIDAITDIGYKKLLQKELNFLKEIQDQVIEYITDTYTHQKNTHDVRKFHCNYSVLEKVCDKYTTLSVDNIIDNASERSEKCQPEVSNKKIGELIKS